MKEYKDELYCDHCNDDTQHRIVDSEHERDSSNDYFECLKCGWWYFGMCFELSPPLNDDDE